MKITLAKNAIGGRPDSTTSGQTAGEYLSPADKRLSNPQRLDALRVRFCRLLMPLYMPDEVGGVAASAQVQAGLAGFEPATLGLEDPCSVP